MLSIFVYEWQKRFWVNFNFWEPTILWWACFVQFFLWNCCIKFLTVRVCGFFWQKLCDKQKNQHWQHWFHEFFSHFYFSLLFSTHYLALHRVMPHSPEIFVVMQINVFCSINLFIRSNIQSWNYEFCFLFYKEVKNSHIGGFFNRSKLWSSS